MPGAKSCVIFVGALRQDSLALRCGIATDVVIIDVGWSLW